MNDVEGHIYEEWIPVGDKVKNILDYEDVSGSYEQEVHVLFETEKGNFVVIQSSGCSCWDPGQDEPEVFSNLQDARERYHEITK
jgi:hypothetical protein